MRTSLEQLMDILKLPDMGGEGRKEKLIAIFAWQIKFRAELEQMKKVRFKEGKFYCSDLTKEERWGSMWCCNLINEIVEGDK